MSGQLFDAPARADPFMGCPSCTYFSWVTFKEQINYVTETSPLYSRAHLLPYDVSIDFHFPFLIF
jgi:hypothetical protein